MKLISQFEKNGTTFVKDEEGNTYSLQLVESADSSVIDLKLKNQIIDMLQNLQLPTHYSGYKILIDCLYFSIKFEECRINLSENLYPKVALLHNMKTNSVPCALDTLVCHLGRTKEYKEMFGPKCVGAKKLILGLTKYFFSQQ